MFTRQPQRIVYRALVAAIAVTLTVGPVARYSQWADVLGAFIPVAAAETSSDSESFMDYANSGQQFGANSAQQAPMPQQNGNQFSFPGSNGQRETIDREDIYAGADKQENQDKSVSEYRNQADDDSSIVTSSNQAMTTTANKDTEYGRAFRTVSGSSQNRSHADMRNDPLFNETKQQYETIQPDQKTCFSSPESPVNPCVVKHKLDTPSHTVWLELAGKEADQMIFEFNLREGKIIQPSEAATTTGGSPGGGSRVNRSASTGPNGSAAGRDIEATIPDEVTGCKKSQPLTKLGEPQAAKWTGTNQRGQQITKPSGPFETELLQEPTCDNGLVGKIRVYDPNPGEDPPDSLAVRWPFRIGHVDGQRWASNGHGKNEDNKCLDSVKLINNGQCGGDINITQGHPVPGPDSGYQAQQCTTWNGWEFCRGDKRSDYLQMPPGETVPLGKFTKRVAVDADCSFRDNCDQYDNDDSCEAVRSSCKDHGRAGGITGQCYSFREIYQCVDDDREQLFGDGGSFSGCETTNSSPGGNQDQTTTKTCQATTSSGGSSCTVSHDMGDPEIYTERLATRLGFRIADKSKCTFRINLNTGNVNTNVRKGSCSSVKSHIDGFDAFKQWLDNFDLSHPDVTLQMGNTIGQRRWCKGVSGRGSQDCTMLEEPYEWTDLPPMAGDDSPLQAEPVDVSNPQEPVAVFKAQDGGGSDANGMAIISRQEFFITDARDVVDEWQDNACRERIKQIENGQASGSVECATQPQTPAKNGESVTRGDDTLDENRGFFENYYESPFDGVSRYCSLVEVDGGVASISGGGSGSSDASGRSCGELESDAGCGYISERCIESNASGGCDLFERTYQCDSDPADGIANPASGRAVDCPGPVRCMGEECVNAPQETNDQFGEVASKVKAMTWIKENTNCTGGGAGCRVFTGEAKECKVAVGGVQDCCDQPVGTTLNDYLEVTYMSARVASTQTLLSGTGYGFNNPTYGVWKAGSQAVDVATEAFGTAWESITGMTSEKAAEATAQGVAEEGIIASAQQALMENAAKFVGRTFGKQAMNMIFNQAVTEGGEQVGQKAFSSVSQVGAQGSGQVVWSGAIQTAASVVGFVMWVYMIYKIATLLIQMAYECVDEEFQLASKRELKAAHKIGTYCNDDSAFGCVEERTSFCTYDSPLGRIVMEQAVRQLPFDFGSAQNPTCQGVTPAQLSALDWSRIDLSEWERIMVNNNRMASSPADITEAGASGHKSTQAKGQEGNYRPNVGSRTMSKVNDDDPSTRRRDSRQNLWGNQ